MNEKVSPRPISPVLHRVILGIILVVGFCLRIFPSAGYQKIGFDEHLYRDFAIAIDQEVLSGYPKISQEYIADQQNPSSMAKLPPTRFLYIFCGWAWKHLEFGNLPPLTGPDPHFKTKDPYLVSLLNVACFTSCALLVLSSLVLSRMFDRNLQLSGTALMAFSPLLIQMGQHALIDGFFAFFAMLSLWLLWENLKNPDRWPWLIGYAFALFLTVITKENSFFVVVALCGLIVANFRFKFGTLTLKTVVTTILGPILGVCFLIFLSGGFHHFSTIYRLLVTKAEVLPYAILTGDGPWYRYLIDLMIVSPAVLLLAIGGLFTQLEKNRSVLFLTLFMAFSYLLMCNIPHGMNLRYATIWELSLCVLAASALQSVTQNFGNRRALFQLIGVVALCAYDLHQYVVFFVNGSLYELQTRSLLEAVGIVKQIH